MPMPYNLDASRFQEGLPFLITPTCSVDPIELRCFYS